MTYQTSLLESILFKFFIAGFVLIAIGLGVLFVGVWLNPTWFVDGLTMVVPLIVSGIAIVAITNKLDEVLN